MSRTAKLIISVVLALGFAATSASVANAAMMHYAYLKPSQDAPKNPR